MSGTAFVKFFPSDWRADPAVQMCSYAARGLWFEMLCLMSEAHGYLMVGEVALDAAKLARLTGGSPDEVADLLKELEAAHVFSRTRSKVIYSRRIVRDLRRSKASSANGKLGGRPQKAMVQNGCQVVDLFDGNNISLDTRYQIPEISAPSRSREISVSGDGKAASGPQNRPAASPRRPPEKRAAGPPADPPVWIREGTAQARAWMAVKPEREHTTRYHPGETGTWRISEWPPPAREARA